MDKLGKVQKLIALAMNNPYEREAMAAAMMAVSLIVSENISLGDRPAVGFDIGTKKVWTPDSEFDDFFNRVANAANDPDGVDPEVFSYQNATATGLKPSARDEGLDDDFMRKRTKIAWRALQRERARLKHEIYLFEQRYHTRYPRPEPMDWEKE